MTKKERYEIARIKNELREKLLDCAYAGHDTKSPEYQAGFECWRSLNKLFEK